MDTPAKPPDGQESELYEDEAVWTGKTLDTVRTA